MPDSILEHHNLKQQAVVVHDFKTLTVQDLSCPEALGEKVTRSSESLGPCGGEVCQIRPVRIFDEGVAFPNVEIEARHTGQLQHRCSGFGLI